jgi:hypothetical protein
METSRKIYRSQIVIGKDTPHHIESRKCKSTMKYHYAPTRITKFQNIENTRFRLRICNSVSFHHCWWGCKMVVTFQGNLVSYKIKHTLTIQYSKCFPCNLSRRKSWKLYPHKNLHIKVYHIVFHNCSNLEVTKILLGSCSSSR